MIVAERSKQGRQSLPPGEKLVQIGALIHPEEKRALEALAQRERLTISVVAREAIRRLLEDEGLGK